MADSRFVLSTFRIPREVHTRMKEYIVDFNSGVLWHEKKMNMTVLIGKALEAYMGKNKVTKVVVNRKDVYGYRKKSKDKLTTQE